MSVASPPPSIEWNRRTLYWLAGTWLLTAALFYPTLRLLVHLWEQDDNYSHGYAVVPISLWLGWRMARRVGPPQGGEGLFASLNLLIGLVLQGAAVVVRWPPLSYLALICILRGTLVAAGGRRWADAFNFPLLFLFFMFPLPVTWTSYLSLWLQDIVARVSETVLSLFVVCHRVGHSLRIAGVDRSLVIAEECSGLGQIIAFAAFAVLLGHLLQRSWWHRLLLVLLAVPTAIVANTLRVLLMHAGAIWFGTSWLSGTLHDMPALFSLPVGILLFLLLDHWLSTWPSPTATPEPVLAPSPGSIPPQRGLQWVIAWLLVGGAGLWLLQAHLQEAGEWSYPNLQASLAGVPLSIPNGNADQALWKGQVLTDQEAHLRQRLSFADDLLMRIYRTEEGDWVRVYMVHSRAGEDRKHHPEICIRDVSGAPEDVAFRQRVPLNAAGSAEAQRFRFWTGANRSLVVYYWHYTLEPVALEGQSRLQRLHQRVGISPPSVTVQVSTSGENPNHLAAVEKTLLPALHAVMEHQILPAGSRCGCDRIPIGLAR
jgi:exosortase